MINRLLNTLLALLLLHCTLFAQQSPRFTISTTGNIALLATIDGVNYTLPNMAQTWLNLQPGTFQVKVFQFQNRPGMEAGYKEVYNGTVKLYAGRHIELVIARFGKVMFDENDIATDTWATGTPGAIGSGSGNNNTGQIAINDRDFAEIKKSLEQERFPDDKLKLSRVLFKNNGFTTGQLSELSTQFAFEDDKLQFLKLAYPACVDKGNYHILARLLKFSSDREALMDFIAKQ
jgi:hypothetical protein